MHVVAREFFARGTTTCLVFVTLTLLVFSSAATAAAVPVCEEVGGTTAVFANGILADNGSAQDSLNKLLELLLPPSGASSDIEGTLAYNPTHGKTLDLIESATQVVAANGGWPTFWRWYWGLDVPVAAKLAYADLALAVAGTAYVINDTDHVLDDHVNIYRNEINNGRNVIIVAHSQGNFFANAAVTQPGTLTTTEKVSTNIVAVANPDACIGGVFVTELGGCTPIPLIQQPVTLTEDKVIALISQTRVNAGLPASMVPTPPITNAPGTNNDSDKHDFVNTYLQEGYASSDPRRSLPLILDNVATAIDETPLPIGTFPFFFDAFDRSDGPLRNDWSTTSDTGGTAFSINNGQASAIGLFGQTGIYRTIDPTVPFTVSLDLSTSPLLTDWTISFFGNGTLNSGVQLRIFSNPPGGPSGAFGVTLVQNGQTITGPVFKPAVTALSQLTIKVDPIAGTIAGDNWPGGYGSFGGAYDRGALGTPTDIMAIGAPVLTAPTIDNVRIAYDCSATPTQIIFSNIGPFDTFGGGFFGATIGGSGGQKLAVPFIPTSNTQLNSVEVAVLDVGNNSNYFLNVTADNAGLPGAVLEAVNSLTFPTYPGGIVKIESVSHPNLSAGTRYWIVIGGDFGVWYFSNQDSTGVAYIGSGDPIWRFSSLSRTPAIRITGN